MLRWILRGLLDLGEFIEPGLGTALIFCGSRIKRPEPARLETRTKETNIYASVRALKPKRVAKAKLGMRATSAPRPNEI